MEIMLKKIFLKILIDFEIMNVVWLKNHPVNLVYQFLIFLMYIFREENIRKHSKKNSIPYVSEKKKNVISEVV